MAVERIRDLSKIFLEDDQKEYKIDREIKDVKLSPDIVSELILFSPSSVGMYVRDGVTDQELLLEILSGPDSLRSRIQNQQKAKITYMSRFSAPRAPPSNTIGIYVKGYFTESHTKIGFQVYYSNKIDPVVTTENFPYSPDGIYKFFGFDFSDIIRSKGTYKVNGTGFNFDGEVIWFYSQVFTVSFDSSMANNNFNLQNFSITFTSGVKIALTSDNGTAVICGNNNFTFSDISFGKVVFTPIKTDTISNDYTVKVQMNDGYAYQYTIPKNGTSVKFSFDPTSPPQTIIA